MKTVWKLQLVQRAAARLLTGVGYREHTTPLLKQLHWHPVCFRMQFKVLVITYKALYGSGPGFVKGCILPYEPTHALRSSGEAFLSVPTTFQACLMGTWERAFLVAAPRLWNSLPREARLAPSALEFQRQSKTFLFQQAFGTTLDLC